MKSRIRRWVSIARERDRSRRGATGRIGTRAAPLAILPATRRAWRGPRLHIQSSSGESGTNGAAAGRCTIDRRARSSVTSAPSCESREQLPQRAQHGGRAEHAVRRPHEQVDAAEGVLLEPEGFTNAALDPVSFHSPRRMPARNENPEPRRSAGTALIVKNESAEAAARTAAKQPLEFDLSPEAAGGVQSETALYRA